MRIAKQVCRTGTWLFALLLANSGGAHASTVSTDLLAGYAGGPGGQAGLSLSDFVQNSPLCIRFEAGFAFLAPGDAVAAREIFVNEADGGTPEKSGHSFTYRLDFSTARTSRQPSGWSLYGGPRYSRFTASFRYVGGNEEFDVKAHQWGLGGGADYVAPMTPTVSLRLSGGADYFFPGTLEGHDSSYNPDNDNVNPKEDFNYGDATRAINQPGLQLRAVAGIQIRIATP